MPRVTTSACAFECVLGILLTLHSGIELGRNTATAIRGDAKRRSCVKPHDGLRFLFCVGSATAAGNRVGARLKILVYAEKGRCTGTLTSVG
jgi:hypothetical protein